MKISELIKILEADLKTHGDLPVLVPVISDSETLAEPMDVAVFDGTTRTPTTPSPAVTRPACTSTSAAGSSHERGTRTMI